MFKTRQSIFKTSSGQRTFNYRATKLWNELDSKFKEITSFVYVVKLLYTILFTRYAYRPRPIKMIRGEKISCERRSGVCLFFPSLHLTYSLFSMLSRLFCCCKRLAVILYHVLMHAR